MIARKYFIFPVVLLMLVGTAYATDLATNKRVIQGSWYCPPTQDLYHRFDFNPDGTFMRLSYLPTKQNKHLWSPSFTTPWQYSFRSPTEIDDGHSGTFLIESLTPDSFRFKWISYGVETQFACSRTRPPGDTDESRIKGIALIKDQKKPFLGKWKTADGKEYVEFFLGDTCIKSFLKAGRWETTKYKFDVYHDGKDAMCGDSGVFSRKAPDKLILDHGMGGDSITYHRVKSSKKN